MDDEATPMSRAHLDYSREQEFARRSPRCDRQATAPPRTAPLIAIAEPKQFETTPRIRGQRVSNERCDDVASARRRRRPDV
jgi:hypothetical protein